MDGEFYHETAGCELGLGLGQIVHMAVLLVKRAYMHDPTVGMYFLTRRNENLTYKSSPVELSRRS